MKRQAMTLRAASIGLRVLLLTALLFVLFAVSSTLTGVGDAVAAAGDQASPAGEPAAMALALLGMCLVQSSVLSLVILRSRWWGWRLILVVFALSFGMMSVLSHLESLVYLRQLSRETIGRMVLSGAMQTAIFSPLAVWMLGRGRRGRHEGEASAPVTRSVPGWVGAVLAVAVLHLALYYLCGYYIAWRAPVVREFYGGEDPGSFWLQLAAIVRGTPGMISFQFGRGVLWALLAAPLAMMLTGARWSAALAAAVLMALFAPVGLLIPNPFMPEAVRLIHFVETVVSRFAFGFLAVWLLRGPGLFTSGKRYAAPVAR